MLKRRERKKEYDIWHGWEHRALVQKRFQMAEYNNQETNTLFFASNKR